MSEEQQKQYLAFIENFVVGCHDDELSRKTVIAAGLSALSAFCVTVLDMSESASMMSKALLP